MCVPGLVAYDMILALKLVSSYPYGSPPGTWRTAITPRKKTVVRTVNFSSVAGPRKRAPNVSTPPAARPPRAVVASFTRNAEAATGEGGFRRVQGKTLSSQIVAQVRESLFAQTLRTGDLLGSEAELAKQFGVSRMSVRDALRMLEAMGIVEIRMGAGGGARIAQASLDRFGDSLAIQLALIGVSPEEVLRAQGAIEGLTAELAARNASSEDLRHMRELLDEAAQYLDDAEMTAELGRAFHMAVAHASHNRVLEAQLNAMRDSLWRPGGMRVANRATAKHVLSTHEAIYEMIEKRDADGARRLMSEHLQHILSKSSGSPAAKQGRSGERSAGVTDHICGGIDPQMMRLR